MEQLRESLSVESFVLEDNLEIEGLEENFTNSLESQAAVIILCR